MSDKRAVHGVRFMDENAADLAILAITGFAAMYCADDLADPVARHIFVTLVRDVRSRVSRDRVFLLLDALNELHPQEQRLRQLVAQMRQHANW